jgi:energy-coupling factor transporter ATP-binding protein EcfA2
MNDSLKHLRIPYPGLRPFEEADGPIFFGRQKQTAVLLRRLQKHRFVAVVGSSGSGKSSLVRAGLLPAIKRGFLIETASWIPVVIRPRRDPYQRLADALLNLRPPSERHTTAKEFELSFRKTLRLTDSGLVNALSALKLDSKAHVLIIVDQFEELFSFRSPITDSDQHASRDDAAAFVSTLLNAFQNQDAKIWVVITMRSDFIGNCEVFLELPEKVSQSQFLVPRLNSWQMEQAIIGPGLIKGAGFQPFTVPQELVNVIINEAGDQPDQLPLMQHALMRTWKNAVARAKAANSPVMITETNYDDAGGIKNALNCDAERAWRSGFSMRSRNWRA